MPAGLRHLLLLVCLSAGLLAFPVHAEAAPSPDYRPLKQFLHRAFPASAGAPPGAWAIAQDPDGYLWFGGPTGLFKFDGVTFDGSSTALLSHPQIMSLLAARDGSLWVGGRNGDVTHIANASAHVYEHEGRTGTVFGLFQGNDGAIWAAQSSGMYRFNGTSWEQRVAAGPNPGGPLRQAFVTKDGTIWALRDNDAFKLRAGASAFEPETPDSFSNARLGREGTSWLPPDLLADPVVDTEGSLWCGTAAGLVRVTWAGNGPATSSPVVETLSEADGMTGPQVLAILKDRDGTMWVSTPKGIDQFRVGAFRPAPLPAVTYKPAIAVDGQDRLWVASNEYVMELGAGVTQWPQAGDRISSIGTALDGTILMVGPPGLLRADGDRIDATPLPAIPGGDGRSYRAVTEARDGSTWIALRTAFRQTGNVTEPFGPHAGLPGPPKTLRVIARRADHGLWLGYDDNTLAMVDDDGHNVRLATGEDGISVGSINALWPRANGVWITGDHGVQFVAASQKARSLRFAGGRTIRIGSGIVERPEGDLWINASDGLYHVKADDLRRWWMDSSLEVPAQRFDERDGWPGLRDAFPAPSLVPSRKGLLWVASDLGVASLDPSALRSNPSAPSATITAVNDSAPPSHLKLAAGTTRIEFRYTAPVLSIPERAQFQYRLLPLDDAWRSSGASRTATYTNLAPGDYTFSVRVANEDGVWSPGMTSLSLGILPFYYQTIWFKLLCVVAAFALLYALYAWRLRVRETVLYARILERERIARELHDGLLQSMHSVLLYVRVATNAVSEVPLKAKLERALHVTEQAMIEGRERIMDLRTGRSGSSSLVGNIRASGAEWLAEGNVALSVTVEGKERSLRPEAQVDIQAMVLELIRNAEKHARSNTVSVVVRFAKKTLEIDVLDDGIGVDTEHRAHSFAFGLQGVRERAAAWSGLFNIAPSQGQGTRAMLILPAAAVYARPSWP